MLAGLLLIGASWVAAIGSLLIPLPYRRQYGDAVSIGAGIGCALGLTIMVAGSIAGATH